MKEINSLCVYAFRYAIQRSTYATKEVADILINRFDDLTLRTKELIICEIQHELTTNNIRMKMDEDIWENVLTHFKKHTVIHE